MTSALIVLMMKILSLSKGMMENTSLYELKILIILMD